MPGINYELGLDSAAFQAGASQSMDYINQLHQRIDNLKGAGGGPGGAEGGFLGRLSTILFQLPQQAIALSGILSSLAVPIKLASEAETVSVAFRTLVGDADLAAETLDKINKMADATPFDPDQLVQAARNLIAFGEAAGTIPETLRRLGDVAAGTGTDINELAQSYGKARIAGTLFGEDINEMTGRGIPIIQEFAAILGVSVSQVKELASQGQISFSHLEEAFKRLSEPGGKFAGMMDELSRTMEGKLGNLTAAFENVLQGLGDGLNEGLKPFVDGIAEHIGKFQDLGEGVGEKMRDALDLSVVISDSKDVVATVTDLFSLLGLTIGNELAKGAQAGFELLKRSIYDGVMELEAGIAEMLGDDKHAKAVRAASAERTQHLFEGVMSGEGPLDRQIEEKRGTFDEVWNKMKARQESRPKEQEQRDEDRFREADQARQDVERRRFLDEEWRRNLLKSQQESLKNAERVGLPKERINTMRQSFLAQQQDAGADLKQVRKDLGMAAVMDEKESKTRRQAGVDAVAGARMKGASASEIQKMQRDFVASAARDGMEPEQLAGLKKDFGMEDKPVSPPSGGGSGPAMGTGPAPRTGVAPPPSGSSGAAPDGDRTIRRRGLRESIERGFQRQAGTGRGAVNWQTYVGRQIGLTPAQRQELLRSGPNAQSLDRMTGRGQERRGRNAAAAEQAREKEQGAQQQQARDKLLGEIAKNVEAIAKELKDEGKT